MADNCAKSNKVVDTNLNSDSPASVAKTKSGQESNNENERWRWSFLDASLRCASDFQ